MSDAANVELAHRLIDAVARQDVERLVELTDPEVEWHSFLAQLREGGEYYGHAGIRQYMNDLRDTFAVLQTEVEDTRAIGDLVVITGRLRYRGTGSGVEAEVRAGYLLRVRGGKAVAMRAFREPEEALEAAGLSP